MRAVVEDIPCGKGRARERATLGEELTREQMKELQALLNTFNSDFSDMPGCIDMAEPCIVTEQHNRCIQEVREERGG